MNIPVHPPSSPYLIANERPAGNTGNRCINVKQLRQQREREGLATPIRGAKTYVLKNAVSR